jgi:hypothetical protein
MEVNTMAKVKILKTGLWAINPPNPGELYIEEGQIRDDIPAHLIKRMFESDTKHIEIINGSDEPEEVDAASEDEEPVEEIEDLPDDGSRETHIVDDVSDIRATLMEIADGADNKNHAKAQLESWGRENLGFEIDRRRSLDKVTADLIAEYEKQNG